MPTHREPALLIGQLSALSQADTSQEWAGDLADYLSNPAEITPQENAYHLAVVRQVNLELDEQGKALDDGWLQLNEGKQQLAESKQQLYSAGSQLDDAAAQLKKARAELDDGWTQLTEKEREFQDGKEEGWQEILNARQELSDGKQGLADGEKEYEEGKAESDQEIADAKKELEQARKDLNELEVPEWYVLDRTDYLGHSDFGDDSDRIAADCPCVSCVLFACGGVGLPDDYDPHGRGTAYTDWNFESIGISFWRNCIEVFGLRAGGDCNRQFGRIGCRYVSVPDDYL